MRRAFLARVAVTLVLGVAVSHVAATLESAVSAQQQGSQFRSSTDIIAIDFLAAQPDGKPVADLTAKEITVKVDGKVRDIKSFQFVKLSAVSRERISAAPVLPLPFASNDGPVPGRSVIIVVDHEQISAAQGRNAFDAASRFIDTLTPIDRAALITMPNGRVESDLTTNHERVREALKKIVGRRPTNSSAPGISNISMEEAITVLNEKDDSDKQFTKELLERECRYAEVETSCRTRVTNDAFRYAREIENQTRDSLRALKEFLNGVGQIEGPKAIVYLSGSLVRFSDTHIDLEDVARAAARARAQMFIVQPHDTIANAERRDQSTSTTADMNIRLTGLQDLAGVTGGELFRMSGTGDLVFGRIADAISSHYLLGFEPKPGENNGKPHKIELTTSRKNVLLHARPMFVLDDNKREGPPPMVLETLLHDFATYRDLPLRATAYVFRDNDPAFVKIVVATEPTDTATTLKSAAFALVSLDGTSAAKWSEEGASVVNRPLITGAAVPPGDYRLRVVALDSSGRRGAVDYEFVARLTEAAPIEVATPMVGESDQGNFKPRMVVESDLAAVNGYVEFYGTLPSGSALTANFEVADRPDGPAIAAASGRVLASAQATRFVATGEVPLDKVGPGDHLLRIVLLVNDKPVTQVSRTFRKK